MAYNIGTKSGLAMKLYWEKFTTFLVVSLHFWTRLIFVGKAGAYPSGAPSV